MQMPAAATSDRVAVAQRTVASDHTNVRRRRYGDVQLNATALMWVVLIGASSGASAGLAGQQDIPDNVACGRCKIQIIPQVILRGGADSDVPFHIPVGAAVDSAGQLYLTMRQSWGEVFVFDSIGVPTKHFGRQGSGPGEYRRIAHIVPRGANLYIFDVGINRATVATGGGAVIRTMTLPGRPGRVIVIDEQRLVMNSVIPTADRIGIPLHLVDHNGAVITSFGGNEPFSASAPYDGVRALAYRQGDSTFWAAHQARYRLEEYTVDGRPVRTINRNAPWFPRYIRREVEPPVALLQDIQIQDDGYLWVLIHTREQDWREAWGTGLDTRAVINDQWDSVLEVVDPRSGRVMARKKLDQYLHRFASPSTLVGYAEDADGTPTITLWRVSLSTTF